MALLPAFLRRPTAILKMPEAIARGLTPTAFIREMKAAGFSYRKTRMLSDWHNVAGTEARKDKLKYVRKDRLPSMRSVADVDWAMEKEYMYKVKVWVQIRPDEPLRERFVNITHDKLITPRQIEQELYARWAGWERYEPEIIKRMEMVGAWHRIELLEEPTPTPFAERE